ncbi:MAG: DUF4124 domain-containing protein [Gammaproteobacteria bacterium]|nr:DUF4124 domain-containing protein [Gammaproteobacteria bacterium]
MRMLLLTVMMIFASSAFAGLYKWIDNEGNVHYSQKRPVNQQFKRLKAPPPAPDNAKPLYKSSAPAKTANKTATAETAKNKEIRAKNCAQAKKNLSNFQIHRRMRDKDGNVTTIDDNVRAKNIKSAQNAISNYCD